MNPQFAFRIVAQSALRGEPEPDSRMTIYSSLAVVAGEMHLVAEHDRAMEAIEAMRASEVKQMSFEKLIGSEPEPNATQ